MKNRKEPERLVKGKAFHKDIQAQWLREAEGTISVERSTSKPNGRRGRIDIHASDDEGDMVAVCEVKASDWDRMTPQAVRRNVQRQIRQIWSYVETELKERTVCPGVIFPKRPKTPGRLEQIEALFNEERIQVVWEDESIEERRERG